MAGMKSASRLTFKATACTISVPATSANLGPGFDSFGLALDVRDKYIGQILDENVIDIDISGFGADSVKRDKNNLVYRAMRRAFDEMGQQPRGVALRQLNNINHGRGLGSSAAAIIGGMYLARSLVLDGDYLLPDEKILSIATEIEGHPDNLCAALYGGATIAWTEKSNNSENQEVLIANKVSISVDSRIKVALFVPEATLATSKARKLLPDHIPFADAIENSVSTAIFSTALSQRPDLLFKATQDRLHQFYRKSGYTKSYELMEFLRGAGLAAFISGAGPCVAILHTLDQAEFDEVLLSVKKKMSDSFIYLPTQISARGVGIEK